ncbi:adenylyl-sulfate kinase [Enterococcus gallinarum]|uniref:adenylyl-sulfate kinase n=1 Tax=Enterococcus gallinarum TaxID=1353 RepID=UPI002DB663BA|nr:adenylyl-sulfate kinase [Enterococcus gallinarum]MEB5857586.1 adenylyl-sulfate kinase [Enterococcus gallinarum]
MKKARVIVVSGVTTSGKTTFIQKVANLCPGTAVLSFDDYSIDALPSAPSSEALLNEPYEAINQFDIQPLINDLKQIIHHCALILIDFPFGYVHQQLAPAIDKAIYLRTPLDIVLGRLIIRDFQQQPEKIINWVTGYLEEARPLFLMHEEIVSPQADYIRDGTIDFQDQMTWFKEEVLAEKTIFAE